MAEGESRTPGLTWRLAGRTAEDIAAPVPWPSPVTPAWAWGGATGEGVRVCVLDSGIEPAHPLVGEVRGSYAAVQDEHGEFRVAEAEPGDVSGHGTACAGIIRSIAPRCALYSVRVLDNRFSGTGDAFIAGLRWAVEQRFDVVNLSLSTSRPAVAAVLRGLADDAYFRRTLLVASAHNRPVESFPWRFASVVSVGSHSEREPSVILYNPDPPVEFFAHGTDVEAPWPGGGRMRVSGNSFATAHVSGYCALILSKHPGLTPFHVKTILHLTSPNVGGHR